MGFAMTGSTRRGISRLTAIPGLSPVFESITWNPPGFTPAGGEGMIYDAAPALGGPFVARWAGSYWDIEYQYC